MRRPAGSGWWASTCATSSSWWVFSTRITPDCRRTSSSVRGGACVGRTAWPGRHHLPRAARGHHDHRLDQREPPGDAGELARVADRLQVQPDDVGAVVVGPELHEVVARRRPRGARPRRTAASPSPRRRTAASSDDRQRRGLAEQPDPPGARRRRGQRRVERSPPPRRDSTPYERGPDHAHARRRARPAAARAAGRAPRARARRSRRRAARPRARRAAPAPRTTSAASPAGHRDDRELDRARARPRALVRVHAVRAGPRRRPRARRPTGRPRAGSPSTRAASAPGATSRRGPRPARRRRPSAPRRNARIERASARCSRSAITASDRSVGSMSNPTATIAVLGALPHLVAGVRNTEIIRPFCGSTSATNRRTPRSRAAAARCSSSTEPSPRPWCASAMLNATSASSSSIRS